jgi:carbon monoxide dehydrogenase subunit G
MRFENAFDVQAPIDEVWATLLDVERVAPCMPGAEVVERTGDDAYKVAIKVKVGPMSMIYKGDVEIVERDDAARTATMRAKAKETRGQGTADANVHMALADGDGGTHATLETDVQLSGRAAAMGRGVIADVAGKLVERFAANLQGMLEAGPQEEPAPAAAAAQPAPEPEPAPRTEEESLPAGEIVASALAGRLSEPRALFLAAGIFGMICVVIGYLLGKAR